MRRLRIGVCGFGSIGSRHARLLSQRCDVDVFITDTVDEHVREGERLPQVVGTADSLEELLEFRLDGIVVATPDQFHVPLAKAACNAGVPVLLEKPIAETVADGEDLKETAARTGTEVMVGYPLRHNAGFLRAKEVLDEGQIGVPVSFHIDLGAYETLVVARNRFEPTDRNKLFIDYSHEWDYLQWFLGKVDRGIALGSLAGNREKKQDPNVVDALLGMSSGISGTAHLDYIRSPGKRRFSVIGDEGWLLLDATSKSLSIRRYSENYDQVYAFDETFDSMMSRQMEHFLEVIQGRSKCKVSVDDGVDALRVAEALVRSVRSNVWEHCFERTLDVPPG